MYDTMMEATWRTFMVAAKAKAPNSKNVQLQSNFVDNLRSFRSQNKLKKAALQCIAGNLEEGKIKALRDIFMGLDANGDGLLTVAELKEGITKSGMKEVPEDLQAIMEDLGLQALINEPPASKKKKKSVTSIVPPSVIVPPPVASGEVVDPWADSFHGPTATQQQQPPATTSNQANSASPTLHLSTSNCHPHHTQMATTQNGDISLASREADATSQFFELNSSPRSRTNRAFAAVSSEFVAASPRPASSILSSTFRAPAQTSLTNRMRKIPSLGSTMNKFMDEAPCN